MYTFFQIKITLMELICRYIGPSVAACPAYLPGKGSSCSTSEEQDAVDVDVEYHYVPPQNIQVFILRMLLEGAWLVLITHSLPQFAL